MREYRSGAAAKVIVAAVLLWSGIEAVADNVSGATESTLLDTSKVKVFEKRYPPGSVSPMKKHPQRSIYFLTDAHFVVTAPDGKTEKRDFKAGTAAWGDDEMLAVTNAGSDEIRIIITYLK